LPSPEFVSHLCVPYSESFPPPACTIFFLSCTASFKASNRRPVANLLLSNHRIRGFPCLLYPAICPNIMSRSESLYRLQLNFFPLDNIHELVIMRKHCVFCEVGTEFLYISVNYCHLQCIWSHSMKDVKFCLAYLTFRPSVSTQCAAVRCHSLLCFYLFWLSLTTGDPAFLLLETATTSLYQK